MTASLFLIPLSILILVGAGIALFWAVDHGQFDDMETPALLPLLDAERSPRTTRRTRRRSGAMTGGLTLGAALLLGFAASGHCLVMCGGISARAGPRHRQERPTAGRALRCSSPTSSAASLSYAIAGALIGGVLGVVVAWLDVDAVRRACARCRPSRSSSRRWSPSARCAIPARGSAGCVWPRLAPLGRRLLPVTNVARALGFGMVWGWMPCGFVYTVMVIAALEHDALRSAATMLAFGARHRAGDDRRRLRRASARRASPPAAPGGASRARC